MSNRFSVGEDTPDVSSGGGNYIEPGLHLDGDVLFTEAKFESISDGKYHVIRVYYQKDVDGEIKELNDTIFEVDEQSARQTARKLIQENKGTKRSIPNLGIKKGDILSEDQTIDVRWNDITSRIKHHLSVFYDKKEQTIDANSWEDLAQQFCDKMNIYQNEPVRLKVVVNNKGFASLPPFGNFVESMKVPLEKTSIKKNANDVFERSEPAESYSSGRQTNAPSAPAAAPSAPPAPPARSASPPPPPPGGSPAPSTPPPAPKQDDAPQTSANRVPPPPTAMN